MAPVKNSRPLYGILSGVTAREDGSRPAAIVAFLGAGLASPPSKAAMVTALAEARRGLASSQSRGVPLIVWLASEARHRGVREKAAVLAALEIPAQRSSVARQFLQGHPECSVHLEKLLAVLDP